MKAQVRISESELILDAKGNIYHLKLKPHQIAPTVITVGDPGRVKNVSRYFDKIEYKAQHREFTTHTGSLNGKNLTVISTGIGTNNIDIVMNELDALVNIDFKTRTVKEKHTSLNIIRLGTSGAVDENIAIDSILISEAAIGIDGLLNFYKQNNNKREKEFIQTFTQYFHTFLNNVNPYFAVAGDNLLAKFEKQYPKGLTLTAGGFYAPQGRHLRAKSEIPDLLNLINQFRHKKTRFSNMEMETAGIYGFGKILGHQCLSINAILANRMHQTFSKHPHKTIDNMIVQALEILTAKVKFQS